MEEAELTSWRFVSSPFSLDLSRTKRHLVPGAQFSLQVSSARAGGGRSVLVLEGRKPFSPLSLTCLSLPP